MLRVLLLWAALAATVLALPLNNVTAIILPLTKIRVLQDNGIFNAQVLQAHVKSLHIKYRQGAANYFANTGRNMPRYRGAQRQYMDKSPIELSSAKSLPNVPSQDNTTLQRRQYLPITSRNGMMWTGKIAVGTPAEQEFIMDFDTGSSDLWVPSTKCLTACGPHSKYDAGKSSTAQESNQPFAISYADGSTSSGYAVVDSIELGGLPVETQTLAQIEDASESFAADPNDGIMGMGFQSISQLNKPPVFDTLVAQRKVPYSVFAFRLAEEDAELCLGDVNPEKYTGSFDWTKIDSDAYWSIPGVASSGQEAVISNSFIVDTGSTLVVGPADEVAKLWSTIRGARESSDYPGYWTYPCDSPPLFSFQFGGGGPAWTLPPGNLNLGKFSPNRCVGAVIGSDLGITSWILGDAFLLGVYAAFDSGSSRIGFATPR